MPKQYLRLLSNEDMKRIHNSSLAILERTGMLVQHQKAREMLQEAGARVDHQSKIVKFPPDLVEESMKKCPQTVVWGGRKPDKDVIGKAMNDIIIGRGTAGGTMYEDLRTGQYRPAKSNDIIEYSVLIDALPNIAVCGAFTAMDLPRRTSDIHCLQLMFENHTKNVGIQPFTAKNLKYMIEMSLAIRGTRGEVRKRPPFAIVTAIISPLFISEEDVDMLLLAGDYGIPAFMCSQPNVGATAPITLAGTLALANAEILGAYTLVQVARPGHPLPYNCIPGVTDMVTGAVQFGAPENISLSAALTQMSEEFYGIISFVGAGENDGLICEQTQFQRACKILAIALAGGGHINLLGAIDRCIGVSPVQLVIDDELIDITRIISRGIEINDDNLGLDAIDRVGPHGNFLVDEHTLRHLRSTKVFRPTIFDRNPEETWRAKGAKGWQQKAREKALNILEQHEVEPLDEDIVKELRIIVSKADDELAK